MIAVEGQPFHDPAADEALLSGLRETAAGVEVHELDLDVNDERFALAMADRLHEMIAGPTPTRRWMTMFVPLSDVRREEFDWGVIGWRLVPSNGCRPSRRHGRRAPARRGPRLPPPPRPGGGDHRQGGHDRPVPRPGVEDPDGGGLGPGTEGVVHASFNDDDSGPPSCRWSSPRRWAGRPGTGSRTSPTRSPGPRSR